MSNDWLRGTSQPKSPPGWVTAHIATAQRGIAVRGWAMSDEWWGTPYHWDGRSAICNGKRDCPLCLAQVAKKWAGYLPMFDEKTGSRFIMSFTKQIADKLEHMRMSYGSLRRYKLILTRQGEARNGKLCINADETTRRPARTPPAWDFRANILAMYGFSFDHIAELLAEVPMLRLHQDEVG